MVFETLGDKKNPAVLFFHAMGVTGKSSERVAYFLKRNYFCILPTSTVYCPGETYISKANEVRQIEEFLHAQGVGELALVVASSIGADLAMAFLTKTALPVEHVFFDGGQFSQIKRSVRRMMTPLLYLAIKSLYWSGGKTLKWILWCDDDAIRPYFAAAGRALTYGNLFRQLSDSLEDRPFPPLPEDMQRRCFFEFGSAEEHIRCRDALMQAYPFGHFPVFENFQHMQEQICDPEGFAAILTSVIEQNALPPLAFLQNQKEEGEKAK